MWPDPSKGLLQRCSKNLNTVRVSRFLKLLFYPRPPDQEFPRKKKMQISLKREQLEEGWATSSDEAPISMKSETDFG